MNQRGCPDECSTADRGGESTGQRHRGGCVICGEGAGHRCCCPSDHRGGCCGSGPVEAVGRVNGDSETLFLYPLWVPVEAAVGERSNRVPGRTRFAHGEYDKSGELTTTEGSGERAFEGAREHPVDHLDCARNKAFGPHEAHVGADRCRPVTGVDIGEVHHGRERRIRRNEISGSEGRGTRAVRVQRDPHCAVHRHRVVSSEIAQTPATDESSDHAVDRTQQCRTGTHGDKTTGDVAVAGDTARHPVGGVGVVD